MRPATMDRQAATDCGGWRAGHNGGDAAPGGGFNRAIGGGDDQARKQCWTMIFG